MWTPVKRVVTAVDANGRAVVQEETDLRPLTADLMPGADIYPVWGTEGAIPPAGRLPVQGTPLPFFPGPGGTRFGFISFPPSDRDAPPGDPPPPEALERLVADFEATVPGLLAAFEPDAPGFHTTPTVDYAIVMAGELTLQLDDGAELTLPTGSCVVQNGTRHAWHNFGTEPAMLGYVIVAAPAG